LFNPQEIRSEIVEGDTESTQQRPFENFETRDDESYEINDGRKCRDIGKPVRRQGGDCGRQPKIRLGSRVKVKLPN
jgi:hypothetical protein